MKILIDSTNKKINVISLLNKNNEVVDVLQGDIDILISIKSLIDKQNLTLQDIEFFDYVKGPGSFTGLRMAATVCNTLNWSLGKISLNQAVFPNYGAEPNIDPKVL